MTNNEWMDVTSAPQSMVVKMYRRSIIMIIAFLVGADLVITVFFNIACMI